MNLQKYHYLIKIAELQSITKASKELYVSQPALTKYINSIEEKLGVKIFDRNTIPIKLTYAGERYIAGIKRMIDLQNQLEKEMEDLSDMRKGRLSVGINSNRAAIWLPYILPAFNARYPGIEVRLVEGNFSDFEEQMQKGDIDISFAALPIFSDEIDYEIISSNKIVLIASKDHPILDGENIQQNSLQNILKLDPQKLNQQEFISLKPGHGLHRTMWQIFELHNIKPGNISYTSNTNTMYCLAAAGIGLAFVTDTCIKYTLPSMMPIFCTVDYPLLIRKNVIAYRKGAFLSAAARAFIDLTKEVVNTHPYLQSPISDGEGEP